MFRDIFEKSHPFQRHTPIHHIPPPPPGYHLADSSFFVLIFSYYFVQFWVCRLVSKGRVVNLWSGEPAINARTLSRQSLPVCHPVPASRSRSPFETKYKPFRKFSGFATESDRQNYSSELQRILINSFCEYFNNVFEYSA